MKNTIQQLTRSIDKDGKVHSDSLSPWAIHNGDILSKTGYTQI